MKIVIIPEHGLERLLIYIQYKQDKKIDDTINQVKRFP